MFLNLLYIFYIIVQIIFITNYKLKNYDKTLKIIITVIYVHINLWIS